MDFSICTNSKTINGIIFWEYFNRVYSGYELCILHMYDLWLKSTADTKGNKHAGKHDNIYYYSANVHIYV